MKILVTIKWVPDPDGPVVLETAAGCVSTRGVDFVNNPFDEIALEEALRVRERLGGEVVVVSVGQEAALRGLRTALAMGADRACLVQARDGGCPSPSEVAEALACVWREEMPDLVLMGKQAVDDDLGQVGGMLAQEVGVPSVTGAVGLDLSSFQEHGKVGVLCEADGGPERIILPIPALVMVDLRLNEPRLPSLMAFARTRRAAIPVIMYNWDRDVRRPGGGFCVLGGRRIVQQRARVMLQSVDELLNVIGEKCAPLDGQSALGKRGTN